MKRLAWYTVVILATLTMALLLWEFRTAVVLFILSLAIAATMRPLVDWFAAHGFSRPLALLFAYVVGVGSLIALLVILSGPFLNDLQEITTDVTSGYEQVTIQWPNGTPFQKSVAQRLPPATELYATITGPQGGTLMETALGFTLGFFDLFGQLLIALVLSVYWSGDQEHFKRLWVSLLPVEMRVRAREIWQNSELGLGAYLRSQLIQSILALILLTVGYQVLGLKYPVVLAVIGTIGWLIPWVGVLLAVIPAMVVGLLVSPVVALLTAAFTLGVLSFLEFVVEPRLFNRRRFSSLLVVIVVLVLLDSFGLIGILIAPPLAAVLQIFANQLLRPSTQTAANEVSQPVFILEERLQSVQTLLGEQPAAPAPEITNLVDRLTKLVFRATHEET